MDEQRKNIKELLLTLTQKDFENDVNLHIHSNFSDGKLSPEELVMDAKNKGYRLIAISDHNTVDAYKNTDLLKNESIIPAIEFDCWYKGVLVHNIVLKQKKKQKQILCVCSIIAIQKT